MQDSMSVPLVKYSPAVRIGNWYEEYCIEEGEIQNFLSKRNKGSLLTQKTRRMFSNLLKEIDLAEMRPYIKFGDTVQLTAAKFKISNEFSRIRPALSLVVTEKTILQTQKINEESEVTVAPSIKPCVRNTFFIKSCDAIDRDGEVLKFGQEFIIENSQEGCPRFIIYSSPKCANLSSPFEPTNITMSGGEMNLPVGVCPKIEIISVLHQGSRFAHPGVYYIYQAIADNYQLGRMKADKYPTIPTGHARWKCQHLNADMRFESEGQPVPSNTQLIIKHVATNQNLAAENVEFQSFFGNECLVSVHDYVDGLKRVQWQNVWAIKIGGVDEPMK